jgi:hypothetical protein
VWQAKLKISSTKVNSENQESGVNFGG